MNGKVVVVLIAALLSGLVIVDAIAKPADSTPAPPPRPLGRAPLGVTLAEIDLLAGGWRASRLTGTAVFNDRDEKIGKIDDVLVASDGSLSIAVVEVGDFLGVGRRLVAIPARQFARVVPRAVVPGATREATRRMPPFVYTGW